MKKLNKKSCTFGVEVSICFTIFVLFVCDEMQLSAFQRLRIVYVLIAIAFNTTDT